jgi:hypothetical protein
VPRGGVYGCQAFEDVQLGRLAFAAGDDAVDVGQDESNSAGWQADAERGPGQVRLTWPLVPIDA